MQLTYYGHSCFTVTSNGTTILFDPFISPNPLAKDIDSSKIKADYIFVSHAHEDHVADLISLARQTHATVVANFEIITWVENQGYAKVHPMNFGTRVFEFGTVHMVPAAHSSAFVDGSNGGSPGGFIVKTQEGSFYYSGDTSLTAEFTMMAHYGKLDTLILPIGGNFTMNVEESIIASDILQCNTVIGVHFDTFGYIVIDKEEAKSKYTAAGKTLHLLDIGASISI
jgi:L-ascorbate metabolism protein UlaG (beta-lactamase superfamily)